MRVADLFLAAALVAATAGIGSAQPVATAYTPLEIAVACAPPPTLEVPSTRFRIVGTQDVVPRTTYGTRDLLVINGGTNAGVQLGQEFFIRRANRFGMSYGAPAAHGARTLGWLHVVAVNDTTAVASLDHVCAAIARDDYLEPFVAPAVPDGADRDEATGEPDFNDMGRILVGSENRSAMGAGDFALIDRGSEQGVKPGARFALYRDVRVAGMPLATVGEIVVISTSPKAALTRITRARDAVVPGDYVAPRK